MPDETEEPTAPEWWQRRCEQMPDGPHFDGPGEWLQWWHGWPLNTLLPDASGQRAFSPKWNSLGGGADNHDWSILWGDCGIKMSSHLITRGWARIDGKEVNSRTAWAAVDDGHIGREELLDLLTQPVGVESVCKLKLPPHLWVSVEITKTDNDFRARMSYFLFAKDRVHEWYCTNRAPDTYLIPLQPLLKKEEPKYFKADLRHLTLWYRKEGEPDCRVLAKHWRLSGQFFDFSTAFCNIVAHGLHYGGCPAGVIEHFVKELNNRLWEAWLKNRDDATFPIKAPRKWPKDKKKGENIRTFIESTYGEHIRRGMNRVDVRKLDPKAVKALEIWAAQRRAEGVDVDINEILPRRSVKVDEALERFAAAGKPVTEKDWRPRGVETPEARLRVRVRRTAYRRAWAQRRGGTKGEPR